MKRDSTEKRELESYQLYRKSLAIGIISIIRRGLARSVTAAV